MKFIELEQILKPLLLNKDVHDKGVIIHKEIERLFPNQKISLYDNRGKTYLIIDKYGHFDYFHNNTNGYSICELSFKRKAYEKEEGRIPAPFYFSTSRHWKIVDFTILPTYEGKTVEESIGEVIKFQDLKKANSDREMREAIVFIKNAKKQFFPNLSYEEVIKKMEYVSHHSWTIRDTLKKEHEQKKKEGLGGR